MNKSVVLLCSLLLLTTSSFAELQLSLSGASYTSINNQRPDLLAGVQLRYLFSEHFTLGAGFDYSFRHQISNSSTKVPFLLVVKDTSGPPISGEYSITKYTESGYCFLFRVNPQLTFGDFLFGLGVGVEYGSYKSTYSYDHEGYSLSNVQFSPSITQVEHNLLWSANVGYKMDPIELVLDFLYKESGNMQIGITARWELFHFTI